MDQRVLEQNYFEKKDCVEWVNAPIDYRAWLISNRDKKLHTPLTYSHSLNELGVLSITALVSGQDRILIQ